jgi:predicted GNAT superfamily acetyltransferase
MTAIRGNYQGAGVGARLKWAQRLRALHEGIEFIKWTFQPVLARNAFFNLEKLGAEVHEYEPNFYGTDYSTAHNEGGQMGIDSDRLFAEWHLSSDKVITLATGEEYEEERSFLEEIEIPNNWDELVAADPAKAIAEQARIKDSFRAAFASGMVCRGFRRDKERPAYLLYND